jgi:membrane protein YdbS with pleckstrin-like domain
MEWLGLAPRARLLFYLQSLSRFVFFWLPVVVVGGSYLTLEAGLMYGLGTSALVLFVLVVVSIWMPSLSFERWSYALRDVDLLIASGVFFRSITSVPTNRIQHVDVRQGPLEQWLGLSRVLVYTASGMGADGVIPGLNVETAEALRDQLVRTEGDGGV